jgi:probable HAF family extracellular repeat protein
VCNGHETCNAAGTCVAGTPLVTNDNNPCTTDACNATTGVSHTPVANGTACNDNNACTNGEACQNGACTGGTAVTCAADQCHTGGTCVPATGCASTNKPDGTPCDDGNACTKGDVCNAGTCQGPTPFTCVPIDSCQDPGTCNPARPAPPPPATDWSLSAWWKMEGDGADASGLGHPLANAGAVPAPGRFGLGMKFDGSACMTTPIFDANGNTIFGDLRPDAFFTMMAWIKPADDYPCPSNDNTVMGRAWDYSMGTVCPNNAAAGPTITGMARSDGDETTSGYPAGYGIAQRGQWTHVAMVHDGQHMIVYYNGKKAFAGPPISEISDTAPVFAVGCMIMPFAGSTTEVNTFHGTIDEVMVFQRDLTADEIWSYYSAADPCDHTVHPNGSACTDNDVCTQTDTCQSGRCTGGNPLVCTRPNTCHLDATCDRVAGCVSPAKPDGTYCDDGQTCTQGESCQGGACQAPSSPYPIVLNVPVEDLGSLPSSPSSFVYDINAAGTSAGSGVINNQAHAWLADGPGSMFDLGTVVASNTNSAALAINDGGTAVGWYQATDGYHAFRWGPPGSGTEDLGTIGDGAFPWDINNAGQFAGNFMTGFYTHGFRYTDGVGVEEVGDLGWPVVGMFGISENGVAVGYADKLMNGFVNQRAVMYENDVIGLVDLNDLIDPLSGWTLESAFKISGDFVIGSGQYNGQPRSFRLRLSTGTVDDVSGNWMSTSAWAVNAFGDVVGYGRPITTLLDGTPASEFVFTDDLGFKNLNDLLPQGSGWNLQGSGVSINNSRQIVGSGTRTGFTGTRIFRMQLPNAHKSSCEARAVCGGGNGDAICLFSDGVVELTPGHFVALFGYDNASSGPVVPAQNEIRIDGNLVPNPQQPPPNILGAGTYAAIFQPTFDVGHTISWTVDGETVTASASSPKLPTTRVGATCILVYVGGQPWYFGATGLGCGDSRHGRIEAESFDARADGSIPHEAVVDHLSDGSWLQYNRVDFGQSGEFNRIRLSVISPSGADQIVVHIDAVDGPVVANLQTFETGPGYIEELAPLSPPPTGIHDVYIVFNGSESAGLDWFDLQQGPAPRAVVVAAPGAPPDAGFPDADYTAEQEEGDSPGPEAWLSLKNPLPIQPHAFDGPSFTSQVRGTVTAVVKWTGGTGPVSVTVVDAGGNTVPGSTETNGNRIKVDTKPLPAQLFHIFIHNDGNAVIQASTLVGFTRSP